MIAIPAIDLKGGNVVRLLHGDFYEEKIYDDSAERVAKQFEEGGAGRLHVVDLDGALKGKAGNLPGIEKIMRAVRIPVQIGGGVREIADAGLYFDLGARWVVLGTKACLDSGFLKEALSEFGEKIIVGIDARDGQVATDGWTRVLPKKAEDMAREVALLGVRTLIYTDISKDGALEGPNMDGIGRMSAAVSADIIASGGISSLNDLQALKKLARGNVTGVIIGKALYEKRFTVAEAVKACS